MILSISLFAHRVNLFTDYDGKSLYISSYFANGDPCVNCDVKIFSQEKLLKQSRTNKQGELNIYLDKQTIRVELDASMGHKVIKNIKLKAKKSEKTDDLTSEKIEKLEEENRKLKQKIKSLQEQVSLMNLVKILFSLIVIVGIFLFLKRVKQ